MQTRTNPYEIAGRLKKATTIAALLFGVRVSSAEAETFSKGQWEMALRAARIDSASEETKAAVIETLRGMETVAKRL